MVQLSWSALSCRVAPSLDHHHPQSLADLRFLRCGMAHRHLVVHCQVDTGTEAHRHHDEVGTLVVVEVLQTMTRISHLLDRDIRDLDRRAEEALVTLVLVPSLVRHHAHLLVEEVHQSEVHRGVHHDEEGEALATVRTAATAEAEAEATLKADRRVP